MPAADARHHDRPEPRPGAARRRPLRRLAGATTALLLAAGGLVALPGAAAAPTPDTPAVPDVLPTPQHVVGNDTGVDLTGTVSLVVGDGADPAAVAATRQVLADHASRVEVRPARDGDEPARGKRVYLGVSAEDAALADTMARLGVEPAAGLPPEGYVVATGRDRGPVLVLDGRDDAGAFYAAQTLRQVVGPDGVVPGLEVRDWPLMEIRGAIEGFYGIPWSHEARLDQLEFYGEHKMNTYIYTPKDDRKLRFEWRELYEGAELERLAELVETANRNHVKFTFALSPGNDVCYSSQEDFDATVAKLEQLRELGVTSFYVALDDIPLELHCDADRERFTADDWGWLADAQTHYLNRLQREYVEPNGLEPLQTVPTNYAGSAEDPYKGRFGDVLDDDVRVQWTGEGVFSDTVTSESVQRAARTYRTDHLFVWDNFPVNDGRRDRLFLNPLTGRDRDLHEHLAGFTSNPMIQPYASMPALAGYGDYTWNPPAYDPAASHARALDELAGDDASVREALELFVDLNQLWPYRADTDRAPAFTADVEAFWAAYESGEQDGREALTQRLTDLADLPSALAPMAEPGFYADARPWIDAASHWASAMLDQTRMLAALEGGDRDGASAHAARSLEHLERAGRPTVDDQGSDGVYHEDRIVPHVGDERFEEFSARALGLFCDAAPDDPSCPVPTLPGTATTTMPQYRDFGPEHMLDGDDSTLFWSSRPPRVGDEIRVDLDEQADVRYVAVHMSDNDHTAGDMVEHGRVEASVDGETWTVLGEFAGSPLVELELDEPVPARHVRVVVTDENPSGRWVKVRELVVSDRTP